MFVFTEFFDVLLKTRVLTFLVQGDPMFPGVNPNVFACFNLPQLPGPKSLASPIFPGSQDLSFEVRRKLKFVVSSLPKLTRAFNIFSIPVCVALLQQCVQ